MNYVCPAGGGGEFAVVTFEDLTQQRWNSMAATSLSLKLVEFASSPNELMFFAERLRFERCWITNNDEHAW